MRKALTIAGSDSCGGAGVQADLKTFAANGVYGTSVITSITAQNSRGVQAAYDLPAAVIGQQLEAIFADIELDAIKIGMVAQATSIATIAATLVKYRTKPVVLDPVMVSSSGHPLLQPNATQALIELLLPLTDLVTPNLAEAEVLTGIKIADLDAMGQAAIAISRLGPRAVLIKGGHLSAAPIDLLFDDQQLLHFHGRRIAGRNTHGTGCTLSAAIAACLAKGATLIDAVRQSKAYVTSAILHDLQIGQGANAPGHFFELYQKAGARIVD